MNTYIHHRAEGTWGAKLQARVNLLPAGLARICGVPTRPKRRAEKERDFQAWMEIHPQVPDRFDAILERAVAKADLPPLINGARHVEYFLDCSSCA